MTKKEEPNQVTIDTIHQAIARRVTATCEDNQGIEGTERSVKRPHVDLQLINPEPPQKSRRVRRLVKSVVASARRTYHLPLLGSVLKWLVIHFRLPTRISQLYDTHQLHSHQLNMLTHDLSKLRERQDAIKAELEEHFGAQLKSQRQWFEEHSRLFQAELTGQSRKMMELINSLRGDFSTLYAEIHERQATPAATGDSNALMSSYLDQFYIGFEHRFRGESAVIKERLQVYLPFIIGTGIDYQKYAAIDIGCGRGEWLKLMKEHEIKAIGLDINAAMVKANTEQNLTAIHVDAFEYLRAQPSESVSIITAFHVVEHLPFIRLVQLFDEAMRVLTPCGVIIFETPNPENLFVGSCNFYTDPSHRNPIPPHTLAYMAEQRGFANIQVVRSSPMEAVPQSTQQLGLLKEMANVGQDYAVVAQKVIS